MFVCMLIYDIICKLVDGLTERDLDLFMLILKIFKNDYVLSFSSSSFSLSPSGLSPSHTACGMEIRRNDSLALKVQCLRRGTGKSLSVFLPSRDKHT